MTCFPGRPRAGVDPGRRNGPRLRVENTPATPRPPHGMGRRPVRRIGTGNGPSRLAALGQVLGEIPAQPVIRNELPCQRFVHAFQESIRLVCPAETVQGFRQVQLG